ncbi:MAG: hypothetical protein IJV41_10640 [Oscillospiraceae bacterium]|nr:hypothetical protein [Oscillospiraceae bacterium]
MPDYQKMYALLCAAASEAIDRIDASRPREARALLQRALWQAEELYVRAGEPAEDRP